MSEFQGYAKPHAWNLVAKILREEFPVGRHVGEQSQRMVVADIAVAFAKRFAEDEGFDPISWLDKCSPDPEMYPLSELWDEPDVADLRF